jgi:hypothetical protein
MTPTTLTFRLGVPALALGALLTASGVEAQPSPPVVKGPFDLPEISALDGMVAVSSSHLVATSVGTIAFYDKGTGQLLTTRTDGTPFDGVRSAADFFRTLWDGSRPTTINDDLNLPSGISCDPADPFDSAASNFCINDYYDLRVVFDEYRKVFWVTGLARNSKSRCPDGGTLTAAQIAARRSKLLMAVSRTEDPRDGWVRQFTNAVPGDGFCNGTSSCPGSPYFDPGDAADFPVLGISPQYVMVSVKLNHREPSQNCQSGWVDESQAIHVWDARKFLEGDWPGCGADCRWTYWDVTDGDGTIVNGFKPAVHHGPAAHNVAWMIARSGDDKVVLAGVPQHAGPKPALVKVRVGASWPVGFSGWNDIEQKPTAAIPNPPPYPAFTHGNAVHRNGLTFLAWTECNDVFGLGLCQPGSGTRVRVFGLRFPLGVPEVNVFSRPAFGFADADAAIEVNEDGDVLVSHVRVGPDIFPKAAYRLLAHGESQFRDLGVLRNGSAPFTGGSDQDIHGIALDPNGHAFWVAHAFGFHAGGGTGSLRMTVGKVAP